jgi:hypothetical protein
LLVAAPLRTSASGCLCPFAGFLLFLFFFDVVLFAQGQIRRLVVLVVLVCVDVVLVCVDVVLVCVDVVLVCVVLVCVDVVLVCVVLVCVVLEVLLLPVGLVVWDLVLDEDVVVLPLIEILFDLIYVLVEIFINFEVLEVFVVFDNRFSTLIPLIVRVVICIVVRVVLRFAVFARITGQVGFEVVGFD